MTAYMVGLIASRDDSWLPDYLEHVPAIIRSFGGEYVSVSGPYRGADAPSPVRQLEGAPFPVNLAAVFRFPSLDAIDRFEASDDYRPFREARERCSDIQSFAFEENASDARMDEASPSTRSDAQDGKQAPTQQEIING